MSEQNQYSEQGRVDLARFVTSRRFSILFSVGMFLLVLMPFTGAMGQSRLLDAPRMAGTVGERFDGFAAVHGQAPPETAQLVEQVNAERRAVYATRAAADKVSVVAVGKIYAAEIIKSAPPKTWFLSEAGQWSQK
jgi:uncharacterized protein YdbL (DUF1318 family)